MPDEQVPEIEASAYWEAISANRGGPLPDSNLDPETASMLRYLHRLTSTPPPAGVRARVDHDMERRRAAQSNGQNHQEHMTMIHTQTTTFQNPAAGARADLLSPRSVPGIRSRPAARWLSRQVAAVALLLMTLGFGYVAFEPFGGSDRPSAPAVVGPAGSTDAHPIVGGWFVQLGAGDPSDVNYAIFHADGTYTDIHPIAGTAIGVWRAIDDHTVQFTSTALNTSFDAGQYRGGTVTVRGTYTLDADGLSFVGTYSVTVKNSSGSDIGSFRSLTAGTRLTVEPEEGSDSSGGGTPTT